MKDKDSRGVQFYIQLVAILCTIGVALFAFATL